MKELGERLHALGKRLWDEDLISVKDADVMQEAEEAMSKTAEAIEADHRATFEEGALHTEGPWEVDGATIRASNGIDIGAVYRGNGENAALIAAAPELLADCEAFVEMMEWLTTEEFSRGDDKPTRDIIHAAIAKAKGSQ